MSLNAEYTPLARLAKHRLHARLNYYHGSSEMRSTAIVALMEYTISAQTALDAFIAARLYSALISHPGPEYHGIFS